ncbi:hypothetical protein QUA81_19850 [Microcoleus sp. F6_B4]
MQRLRFLLESVVSSLRKRQNLLLAKADPSAIAPIVEGWLHVGHH